MTSNNKFCPDCSTLLHPKEKYFETEEVNLDDEKKEDGLYLVCDDCGYDEKINTFVAKHFSKKNEKTQYVNPTRITNDYIYDMTYSRTRTKICSNIKCSSRGGKNPEIVLITSEDHPEIAYLCTICKSMWGKM
jgi:DNA-directed RNA polymerase subunit M/transcription elongation factor TFIIS